MIWKSWGSFGIGWRHSQWTMQGHQPWIFEDNLWIRKVVAALLEDAWSLLNGDWWWCLCVWTVTCKTSRLSLSLTLCFWYEKICRSRFAFSFLLSPFVVSTLTLPFFQIYLFLDQHYSAVKFRYQWTVVFASFPSLLLFIHS